MSSDRRSNEGLDKDTRRRMTIALCNQPVITQLVDTALASKLKREENKFKIAQEQKTDTKAKASSSSKSVEGTSKKAKVGTDILKLASKYCNDQPCYPGGLFSGAFNYCIRVDFDDDEGVEAHWLMRFPIPGAVMYPEAKVRHEVAVMEYLRAKTSIPIPKIIAWGNAKDNIIEGVGPFIIMEFIGGKPLHEVLRGVPIEEVFRKKTADEFFAELERKAKAGLGDDEVLDPHIDASMLETVYRQMANIYLELAEHDFDKIGSLTMSDGLNPTWTIGAPPYTNFANELERVSGVRQQNCTEPFSSAAEYFLHVAQGKIETMHRQRNSIEDRGYSRENYVARHLFRATVPTFLDYKHNKGPFKLVCDDLRPGNILVDRDLKITAICDWEWSYTAPYQQFCTAPRWLMLQAPDGWVPGAPYGDGPGEDDMLKAYGKRLDQFIHILELEEEKRAAAKLSCPQVPSISSPPAGSSAPADWFHSLMIHDDGDAEDEMPGLDDKPFTPSHTPADFKPPKTEPLSSLMRKSFTNGQFWFNECLRAYNFHRIYWDRLHDLHYGPKASINACVDQWLDIPMNKHFDKFYEKKLVDLREYQKEYTSSSNGLM